jgi:hypothetical protein
MKTLKEAINDHIKLSKEWIKEGKFTCQAEMVYAQNIQANIELYEARRAEEDSRRGDEILPDPTAG